MFTKLASRCWTSAAVLLLLIVTGCATSTPTTSPVIGAKPVATPLPASVSRIDPQSSQPWLYEVETFLKEADSLLKGETTKCSFCSAP
ncbi:hypothetical protein SAMN05518845_11949 [Variovorax sp. YR750]|nr:hypothetical protein SAMN05518845_11949 [Variovorax sp. YR750]